MKYLLLILTLCFASCTEKSTPSSQVLRLNLSADPVSLDPRLVRSLKDLTLMKQLYEGLTRLDEKGEPQLALAERVEISEDNLTYTFSLRPSTWSDGTPLTADDFVRSWSEALSPQKPADYAYMLFPLKNARAFREDPLLPLGIKALDSQTLQVTLQAPIPYFLELVAFPTYFPVHPTNTKLTNGPFCLASWELQSKVVFKKNPCYWDQEAVHLDELVFNIIPDPLTENLLYEKEELDWLGQPISNNLSPQLLSEKTDELHSYSIAGTYWLRFNTQQAPFDNAKMRKAFSYAIHRQPLIEHVLQGGQTIATGPLPPSMALTATPYFTDGADEEARLLFAEALAEKGWTRDSFPSLIYYHSNAPRDRSIAQVLQLQWKEALGITVELQALETQVYLSKLKQGAFQLGAGQWIADYNDPLAFLELFATGGGMQGTGWSNQIYNQLIEQAQKENDPLKRKEVLYRAEKLLVDEMPIAPLYHYAFDYMKKPYVEGVVLSRLGCADFKSARTR